MEFEPKLVTPTASVTPIRLTNAFALTRAVFVYPKKSMLARAVEGDGHAHRVPLRHVGVFDHEREILPGRGDVWMGAPRNHRRDHTDVVEPTGA